MGSIQDIKGHITLEGSLLTERIVFCSLLGLTLLLLLTGAIAVTVMWNRRERAREREVLMRQRSAALWGAWDQEERRFVKKGGPTRLVLEEDDGGV
ncbi:hypothetical protein IAR50_003526 [Cryptococcus sp. DSM 104548]